MADLPPILIVAAINLWIAYQYSRQPVGSDEALWLLPATTGTKPFTDYVGGMGGLSYYLWGWSKVVGKDIRLLKFIMMATIGAMPVLATAWGGLVVGLTATVMTMSAYLFAFQSWYDAASGGLMLLAVMALGRNEPAIALAIAGIAVAVNIKSGPPLAVGFLVAGQGLLLPIGAGFLAIFLIGARILAPDWFEDMWYEMVTLTLRTPKAREGFTMDHRTRPALLLLGVGAATLYFTGYSLEPTALVVAGMHVVITLAGRRVRANHLLGLAPLALLFTDVRGAAAFFLLDFLTLDLYITNHWLLTYKSFWAWVDESQWMGTLLRDIPGKLWINSFLAQIHCYARKPLLYHTTNELEFRSYTPELMERERKMLEVDPPDWMVVGPYPVAMYPAMERGYVQVIQGEALQLWFRKDFDFDVSIIHQRAKEMAGG